MAGASIHRLVSASRRLPRCIRPAGFQQMVVRSHSDRNVIHIDEVFAHLMMLSLKCSIPVTPSRSQQSAESIRHVAPTTQVALPSGSVGARCRASFGRDGHADRPPGYRSSDRRLRPKGLGTGCDQRTGGLVQHRSSRRSGVAVNDSSSLVWCSFDISHRPYPPQTAGAAACLSAALHQLFRGRTDVSHDGAPLIRAMPG